MSPRVPRFRLSPRFRRSRSPYRRASVPTRARDGALLAASALLGHSALKQHRDLAKEIHGPDPGEAAAELQQTKWSAYDVHGNGGTRLFVAAALFFAAVATCVGCIAPLFTATYHVPVFHDGVDPVSGWTVVIKDTMKHQGDKLGRKLLDDDVAQKRETLRDALADVGFRIPVEHGAASLGGDAGPLPLDATHGVDVMSGFLNSVMGGGMDDRQIESALHMLDAAGMLPEPPHLEPKSWSLMDATYDTAFLKNDQAGKVGGSPSRTGQMFLAATFAIVTILAPAMRVAMHWISWHASWNGVREHESVMRLSALVGSFAGVDVTLLALLILSWRMEDTSEMFSEKQGGCIAGECFRITVKLESGAYWAFVGLLMSCILGYVMGRLQAQARVAVLEGAAAGEGPTKVAEVRSKWDLPYADASGGLGGAGSYGSLSGEGGHGVAGGNRDDSTAW